MKRIGPWFVLIILGMWSASCTPIMEENLATQNSPDVSDTNNHVQIIGAQSQPNFLFISIDDLNMSPGIYGGQAKTPNIDRLAGQGTLFTNAHVNAVRCNPSRTSLVTGLRPTSTGIFLNTQARQWRDNLAASGYEDIITLPQHMRSAGYYAAVSGKLYHGRELQLSDGWDAYYGKPAFIAPQNKPMSGYDPGRFASWDWGAAESATTEEDPNRYYSEADLPDYKITEQALAMIETLPDEQPFFFNVGYSLPHAPLYVPQRMIDLYPTKQVELPEILEDDVDDLPKSGLNLTTIEDRTSQQYFRKKQVWREMIAHYLAAVSYVDEQIGIVLEAMERHDRLENTIIILWSDHGFHLGEKERLFKGTLWQESTHVPFIIVAPNLTQSGSVVDSPVSAVDIFPTMIDLAGVEMPTDYPRDGRSIVPLLEDSNASWPWPVATSLSQEAVSIRTEEWTYIRYDVGQTKPHDVELYHRGNDPHEWYNVLFDLADLRRPDAATLNRLDQLLLGQAIANVIPVARSGEVILSSAERVPVQLFASDDNADVLQFTLVELPSQGQLYLHEDSADEITETGLLLSNLYPDSMTLFYEPYSGGTTDSFTFSASDGIGATVAQITINNEFE